MRKGFIFNSAKKRNAFKVRCEDVARPHFKGGVNQYGVDLKHPTLKKYGYEVEVNDRAEWIAIEKELNPNDITNLITFDSSWFPNNDI